MSKSFKTVEQEISELATKIPSLLPHIRTEEAAKTAIIWPLLRILGYDPFNPTEIVPEYPAPPGCKLGKKVDIAIMDNGKPLMIWECKWSGKELEAKDADQLREYFPFVETVHLAVLTNGKRFLFYADSQRPNLMDAAPFFEIDLLNPDSRDLKLLARFGKPIKLKQILEWARSRVVVEGIKSILLKEFGKPSEDFVKLVVKQMPDVGKVGSKMLERYTKRMVRATGELFTEKTELPPIQPQVTMNASPGLSEETTKEIDALKTRNVELAREVTEQTQRMKDFENQYMQLRTVFSRFLLASGLKLAKRQEGVVGLIDKADGSLLCNIYFDSVSNELGFIDGNDSNQRIGLQQFARSPERTNGLLRLLNVGQALDESQTQDSPEPLQG
jgi:predicted type IV restriction endonuclease